MDEDCYNNNALKCLLIATILMKFQICVYNWKWELQLLSDCFNHKAFIAKNIDLESF